MHSVRRPCCWSSTASSQVARASRRTSSRHRDTRTCERCRTRWPRRRVELRLSRRASQRPRRSLSRVDPRPPFAWIDSERGIRYGPGVSEEAPELLAGRGFERFALLTTERAAADAPERVAARAVVLHVPGSGAPEAAAAVRGDVGGRPLVALGGGRVVDAGKAIG